MKKIVLSVFAVAALAGAASARPMFHYEFPLSGLEEFPPNASPASGFAIVDLNSDTGMLSWNVSYQGLLGTQTAAHFHGAAPPGMNAGVRVGIGVGNPLIGSAMISDAFENELIAGLWYVNIHSSIFPGGEIRGQVVPTPGALALLGLGGLIAARRRRA
jgi:hypothetical protein